MDAPCKTPRWRLGAGRRRAFRGVSRRSTIVLAATAPPPRAITTSRWRRQALHPDRHRLVPNGRTTDHEVPLNRVIALTTLFALTQAATGCRVGPDFERPKVTMN